MLINFLKDLGYIHRPEDPAAQRGCAWDPGDSEPISWFGLFRGECQSALYSLQYTNNNTHLLSIAGLQLEFKYDWQYKINQHRSFYWAIQFLK